MPSLWINRDLWTVASDERPPMHGLLRRVDVQTRSVAVLGEPLEGRGLFDDVHQRANAHC